jgi:hypothetical protein
MKRKGPMLTPEMWLLAMSAFVCIHDAKDSFTRTAAPYACDSFKVWKDGNQLEC